MLKIKRSRYKSLMLAIYDRNKDGCRYCSRCDDCSLPACVCDGYDPHWKPERELMKDSYSKTWTRSELQHFKELSYLKLDTATLANIFRTTEKEIRKVMYDIRKS